MSAPAAAQCLEQAVRHVYGPERYDALLEHVRAAVRANMESVIEAVKENHRAPSLGHMARAGTELGHVAGRLNREHPGLGDAMVETVACYVDEQKAELARRASEHAAWRTRDTN
mgnify:CR=1 FL=1